MPEAQLLGRIPEFGVDGDFVIVLLVSDKGLCCCWSCRGFTARGNLVSCMWVTAYVKIEGVVRSLAVRHRSFGIRAGGVLVLALVLQTRLTRRSTGKAPRRPQRTGLVRVACCVSRIKTISVKVFAVQSQ